MALAIGMIEILGVPTAMEVADAMCKGARVTLMSFENTDVGRITVIVRGSVSEVQQAVAAGLQSIDRVNGGKLLSHHWIARPHDNLEAVLRIGRSEEVEGFDRPYREEDGVRSIGFPPPLSP